MAPSIATSTTVAESGNTWIANRPTGTASGDFLLTFIHFDQNTDTVATPPSGWVLELGPENDDTDARGYVYSKVAGASEPSTYTWTMSGSPDGAISVVRITGASTSNPVDQKASQGNAVASTSHPTPTTTTTASDSLVVAFIGIDAASGTPPTYTPPSGWTEAFDAEGTNDTKVTCASIVQASPGAISGTFTSSLTDTSVAFILNVRTPATTVSFGQAFEENIAFGVAETESRTYGPALESDTANKFGIGKGFGFASEGDAAFAFSAARAYLFGQANEGDQAFPVSPTFSVAVGTAFELDIAQGLGSVKVKAFGLAAETDTALVTTVLRSITIGQAQELDVATTFGRTKRLTFKLVSESDVAFRIARPRIPVVDATIVPRRLTAKLERA